MCFQRRNDQQFPICSQDLAGQQAQQNSTVRGSEIFSRSSPIPVSAILRPVRENRLSSGENTSTVSLRFAYAFCCVVLSSLLSLLFQWFSVDVAHIMWQGSWGPYRTFFFRSIARTVVVTYSWTCQPFQHPWLISRTWARTCCSLRESTCTQRKEIQSSENTSRSAETAPDDNSHQQVALATPTTTASSCPRPRDQPRMLERLTCSAICNDDSSSWQ
jgi:hypothetical protein